MIFIFFSKSYCFCQTSCPAFAYSGFSKILKIKKYEVVTFAVPESGYNQMAFGLHTHSTFMDINNKRQQALSSVTAEISQSAWKNQLCVSMLCLYVVQTNLKGLWVQLSWWTDSMAKSVRDMEEGMEGEKSAAWTVMILVTVEKKKKKKSWF